MSKQSRMLIVIALFAIIAVVALALMAQRYGALLQRQAAPQHNGERTAAPGAD